MSFESIKIIDNFFHHNILSQIKDCIINKYTNWTNFSTYRDYQNRFGAKSYWEICLNKDIFFTTTLKDIIEQKYNQKLTLIRVMILCTLFSHDGSYHYDHEDTNLLYENGADFNSKEITFCLYIHLSSTINTDIHDGNIYFKLPNKKYIICVDTIDNRGILFPGFLLHKPTGYNINNYKQRICITWKFIEGDI